MMILAPFMSFRRFDSSGVAVVVRWLEGLPDAPKMVFTTHGEPDAASAMAQHIRDRFAWNVIVPDYEQKVELESEK